MCKISSGSPHNPDGPSELSRETSMRVRVQTRSAHAPSPRDTECYCSKLKLEQRLDVKCSGMAGAPCRELRGLPGRVWILGVVEEPYVRHGVQSSYRRMVSGLDKESLQQSVSVEYPGTPIPSARDSVLIPEP